MNVSTKSRIQMVSASCALLYVALVVIGWIIVAGFFPLHLPSATAADIAPIFQTDHIRIAIGMIMVMFAALAAIPYSSVIAHYVARIEGGASVLTYMVLLGGAGLMVLTFYPAIWWLVAAFRPERAPDLIYLMNDMSWLQFIGGVSMYDAMPLAMIIATLCDTSPVPVFPRWFAWYNLWTMVVVFPDMLLFFFHTGPFAWNGLFGFWVPLSGFGSWFFVTYYVLRKAILRDRNNGVA